MGTYYHPVVGKDLGEQPGCAEMPVTNNDGSLLPRLRSPVPQGDRQAIPSAEQKLTHGKVPAWDPLPQSRVSQLVAEEMEVLWVREGRGCVVGVREVAILSIRLDGAEPWQWEKSDEGVHEQGCPRGQDLPEEPTSAAQERPRISGTNAPEKHGMQEQTDSTALCAHPRLIRSSSTLQWLLDWIV